MAAAGPAAGPSTSKKVLDLNLYSDLNQNQEVSLTFTYFSSQQMHQCEQRRAVDLKFKCTHFIYYECEVITTIHNFSLFVTGAYIYGFVLVCAIKIKLQ